MASESIITLYDAASSDGKPLGWNTAVLRIRYALNFKGIPYKTVWVEYPDIEPTLRSIGAEPTSTKPDSSPYYTIPVIVDPSRRAPDGGPTVISNSWTIVEYLDKAYPSPGLLLPEGSKTLQALFLQVIADTVFYPTFTILVPLLVDFLSEASRPYWRKTREAAAGVKLEEMCPRGTQKWDDAWAKLQKGFTDIAVLLDTNGGSEAGEESFIMGKNVTYSDFLVASVLETLFVVLPDEWEKNIKYWDSGRWERFRNDCAGWRAVD